ncbi:unnamed protein product [Prorocentrum cordatum]|uniref:RNase H type-1 domain-containing protein n=1 Tax=Prorocentrum cordatum TaxID=2364126 RepID=A0ABN9VL80_9DINO|nr:unnamed protein product [Polarella glacialis]
MGWSCATAGILQRPGLPDLDLWTLSGRLLGHELRQGCRSALWRQVARRQLWYLDGLDPDAGIDLDAALSFMKHKGADALSDYEMGVLRSVLTGGVRPQSRLFKAGLVESATCPLCQAAEGTLGHLFWECRCTAALRRELPPAVVQAAQNGTLPRCLTRCGIVCEPPEVREAGGWLAAAAPGQEQLLGQWRLRVSQQAWYRGGRLVIATDGACWNQQLGWARRAGLGIYVGPRCGNLSAALPGMDQCSGRAELLAIILVFAEAGRLGLQVEILTDYECAAKAWAAWSGGPSFHPREQLDLWRRLEPLARAALAAGSALTWVAAHGRAAREQELRWNKLVDDLVVQGSKRHTGLQRLTQAIRLKEANQEKAQAVQRHMVRGRAGGGGGRGRGERPWKRQRAAAVAVEGRS